MEWTRGHTLGHGSSATVSVATCRRSNDIFAVKSAELHQSEFLQRETKILSNLTSPYIIGYKGYDITRENNKVMYNLHIDYAQGGSLSELTRNQGGKLEEPRIVYYARQILQGLEYIHSKGIVHCDIKGSNILITKTGAKVADFGCAKGVDSAKTEAATQLSGTPVFMAPEVARGDHQGFASDIWSFGCTIIEMITGGSPWGNVENPLSVIYRIGCSDELPEFPSGLSEQGRDFLGKCLRRNPNERWSANQLLKHPFLISISNCDFLQVENSNSISPTSILDQGIWNSNEEYYYKSSTSDQRIQRLVFDGPTLDWCDDDSWITIRDYGNHEDDDDDDDMNCCCGSIMDLSSFSLEETKSSCCVEDLDRYISASNNFNNNNNRTQKSVVISHSLFDRDNNHLLIHSSIL